MSTTHLPSLKPSPVHPDVNEQVETAIESPQSVTTCVDEKTTPENYDDVVDHLRRGAERVANVDELVESAVKSFKMIEKWYNERSVCVHPSLAIPLLGGVGHCFAWHVRVSLVLFKKIQI